MYFTNESFGNINNQSIYEIINGIERKQFIKRIKAAKSACEECDYFSFCKGGCTKFSNYFNKGIQNSSIICEDLIMIYEHIINRIHNDHPDIAKLIVPELL